MPPSTAGRDACRYRTGIFEHFSLPACLCLTAAMILLTTSRRTGRLDDSFEIMKLNHIGGFCGLLAFTAVLATPALRAADSRDTNYTSQLWAAEDSGKIMQAAADITTAKYPDSDSATVEKNLVRVYHPDGTAECQDESFVKVLTEKGRRENRTIELGFMRPYSTNYVARLEVIKPDGSVEPVDVAANSKVAINAGQMSENISDPNDLVLQVNLPKVEVGDVIHAITRNTITLAIIPGHFADENVFEDTGYIRHIACEVHAPAGLPLKSIALRDPVAGTVSSSSETNAGGGITYHWEVNNVPRMFGEPSMPPYESVLQRQLVSTLTDWPAVSRWYWDLSKPHLEATSPELLAKVDFLTNGADSDLAKVKALFYYVSGNVRYMGLTPEKDRPGFEPHDVKLTFAKNYGVCRDKAGLLVAFLRAAGFNAYPVLINIGGKLDPEVASPDFNHAIVGVELTKGEYTLMDPTDEHTRDLLPYYDCNRSYLVCRPEGETLLTSRVHPPEEHMMRVTTTGTLSVDGALTAKSVLSFEGVNDDAYRNAFVSMKPDDRRRFFEANLKQTLPGARLESLKLFPANMLDMSENVRAELTFSATGLTATGSGKAIVNLPWIGGHVGMVNFILRGTGLDKRKYPLDTTTTCGLEEKLTLKLDPGFGDAISLPTCTPDEDRNLSWNEQCTCANGTLSGTRTLKLKTIEFSPAAYAKLKGTLKTMVYDGRKSPILAVTAKPAASVVTAEAAASAAVSSDAKILHSDKTLTFTDAHTAVFRVKYSKQILSYNGKKREAELKLDFNPATESARLISGTVIGKDGKRETISDSEINVMDAGWNASAKRYTGGKVLVANLPDVAIGSTIEVEFEVAYHGRPFLAGSDLFQLPDEVAAKSFTITAPDGLPLQTRVTGPEGIIQAAKTEKDGQTTQVWSAQNVKALPSEPGTPPAWLWRSGVQYFAGDAAGYYRDLNKALLAAAAQNTKAAAQAKELTAAAKTRLDAVRAIRDFVAESIRPAGPSFLELPLSELSAADTTLADGYGHEADRAILLHALLTAAGFRPEFVLASELPDLKAVTRFEKAFPLPGDFGGVLVRVKVEGETYYLNDTDQYAQLGTTAHDGCLGILPATGDREWIKAAKHDGDRSETGYAITLADDGRVRVQVATHFYGTAYNSRHRYFAELPPEERRRYYQEVVSGFSQGARPVGDLVTQFDTYPGLEQYTVDVDNYGVVDGRYLYFDLPFAPGLFPVGSDHRTLPLYQPGTGHEEIRTEITLPAAFPQVVIAPPGKRIAAPGGVARITAKNTAGKYVLTDDLESKPAIVTPAEYPELLKAEAALREKSGQVFLLEKN